MPRSSSPAEEIEFIGASQQTNGVVEEVLPRGMYRVRLDGGRVVRAGLALDARHAIVRVIAGTSVTVRLSPTDPSRGQITGIR